MLAWAACIVALSSGVRPGLDGRLMSEQRAAPAAPSLSALRRAAGGDDVGAVEALLAAGGWTAAELDGGVDGSGKNALHFAAWRGALATISRLLDLGMDADAVATGEHNYGKTPVFFALTRCRDDAATLLLARGARARVVNNKGQSVLSLAASHCARATVDAVLAAEAAGAAAERAGGAAAAALRATSARATATGSFYGDSDPRRAPRAVGRRRPAATCSRSAGTRSARRRARRAAAASSATTCTPPPPPRAARRSSGCRRRRRATRASARRGRRRGRRRRGRRD